MQYDYSLGYVIGTLNGDGSLHRSIDYHYFDHKSRQVVKAKSVRRVPRYRYTIVLSVNDKDFSDAFAKHLERVTGKKVCKWTTKRGEHKAILVSKEWYEKLLPLKTDLEWLKTTDIEVKRGFLRGMFDSDGSVMKREYGHRIFLYKSEAKLKVCQELLKDFGIGTTVIAEIKNANCSRLAFGERSNIINFRDEINFYIKRKRDCLEQSHSAVNSTPHHVSP